MRSDIVPGGVFPDYELPDHTGTRRSLSELQCDDPLIILTLARGHYCPKEHQQHLELAVFYPKDAVSISISRACSTVSLPLYPTCRNRRADIHQHRSVFGRAMRIVQISGPDEPATAPLLTGRCHRTFLRQMLN